MELPLVKSTATRGRSVRQRIFDALEARILAVEDDGAKVWRAVYYGDPEGIGNDKTPFIAIDTGTEDKISSYGGCTVYDVPVFFHMRWKNNRGLDLQDKYHYYLALLQLAVLGEHNLGGLTQNIEEVNNANNMVGINDAYPGGTLSVMVQYKTRLHDPYRSPHDSN